MDASSFPDTPSGWSSWHQLSCRRFQVSSFNGKPKEAAEMQAQTGVG